MQQVRHDTANKCSPNSQSITYFVVSYVRSNARQAADGVQGAHTLVRREVPRHIKLLAEELRHQLAVRLHGDTIRMRSWACSGACHLAAQTLSPYLGREGWLGYEDVAFVALLPPELQRQ